MLDNKMTEQQNGTPRQTIDNFIGIGRIADCDPNLLEMASYHLKCYEERMIGHIYLVPHTPPTLFEMRIKHKDVKNEIIKVYEKNLIQTETKEEMVRLLTLHLERAIESSFDSIVELSMKEYKMCQTGFIIGWKDEKRKVSKTENNRSIDDRF